MDSDLPLRASFELSSPLLQLLRVWLFGHNTVHLVVALSSNSSTYILPTDLRNAASPCEYAVSHDEGGSEGATERRYGMAAKVPPQGFEPQTR